MKAKKIKTEESVGKIICHDITKIEKGIFKGARFKKGHVICKEDIEVLLNLGKKHIYSLEMCPGEIHENEACLKIAKALTGEGVKIEEPSEGRVNLVSERRGILKVDVSKLNAINSLVDVAVATLHTNLPVEKFTRVAGVKLIPLITRDKVIQNIENICTKGDSVIKVLPYIKFNIGCIITGAEIKEGRVKDEFLPILKEKIKYFNANLLTTYYLADSPGLIEEQINKLYENNCNLIIVTGGMSVDPDDVTPEAIRKASTEIVKYGAPVLPGGMFMLAYKNDTPVIGLPACAMYYENTILDIIMPKIMAGEKVTREDIMFLGHGGLCLSCHECRFPNCSFGKGGI